MNSKIYNQKMTAGKKYSIQMLISGGQTGVDRAALDFAMAMKIPCSGWCPAGRRAEDGPIADCYPLLEASSELYQQRTRLNVRDSDATLIIADSSPSNGTRLTVEYCQKMRKPFHILNSEAFFDRPPKLKALSSPAIEVPENESHRQKNTDDLSDTEWFEVAETLNWLHKTRPGILNIAGPRKSESPQTELLARSLLRMLFVPSKMSTPVWPPRRPITRTLNFG
ncbi:MAG TPA: putative molybdenum carrier protein [Candidatus Rifleibacterium sp.]|jgi:hypothetical protein|nr:putative molybdenum carrier protein [Candidatus Rifleibacterium sp.]